MAAVSKYLTAGNSSIAGALLFAVYVLKQRLSSGSSGDKGASKPRLDNDKDRKTDKAAVDKLFFRRICHIIKILLPQAFCKESGYLLLIAVMLMARTYCDVWMIHNGTMIESAIIGRSTTSFKRYLVNFITVMPFISLVNNFLKLGLNELKLCFRVRLTNHLYNDYLTGFTYYQIGNLDNRIANPDQLITQDVEKFCNSVVDLYSNVSKPLLDILIYICKLNTAIGSLGPASLLCYLLFSGLLLTRLRRPIGKMTMMEQKYEGEYRYVNSRLITNSEEIAFYNGNRREKQTINGTFQKLVDHLNRFIQFRFSMGVMDSIIAKYIAMAVGYLVISRPFLDLTNQRHVNSTYSERLESQVLFVIFLNVDMVSNPSVSSVFQNKLHPFIHRFEHIPLATPNGDILIRDLSFEVSSGTNVLVCGPNGCGKSSLFRVLGELWPLYGGELTKPERGKLFYVPQRPYMTLGSLRDQVIYPDTHEDQKKKGTSDRVLKEYLDNVQLGHILEREGSWDSVQDWMDVLSGGEKQRMAMARLFYHKPQFAILDECTSAVSVDVEDFIYSHCRKVGITLFTVSHRKSLWKHHEHYLHMDGRGNYEFKLITKETVEFGS
ncbi:ATP-binding cassette sub-family D member 3b [Garra rufa]|uniref:ATP-binding cassette sub-family D member 3b n=1 Tax=Garra rufa TaxID=137080 RepID=UPI003CCE9596